MIYHITAKLAKKLRTAPLGQSDEEATENLHWYAAPFRTAKQHYILTTHATSLFSVVIYSRGIIDSSHFQNQFLLALSELMDEYGYGTIYQKSIAPHAGESLFLKTCSRSILGSMNDMIRCCQSILNEEPMSLSELSHFINRTLFSAIGYNRPADVFKVSAGTEAT
jgi:hypothetical protein